MSFHPHYDDFFYGGIIIRDNQFHSLEYDIIFVPNALKNVLIDRSFQFAEWGSEPMFACRRAVVLCGQTSTLLQYDRRGKQENQKFVSIGLFSFWSPMWYSGRKCRLARMNSGYLNNYCAQMPLIE
jgi:hypothetical protein